MGRKKTPNAVLRKRKSPAVRNEPDPRAGKVMPTYPLSPEGGRAWHRISIEMEAMGTLSPSWADFMTIAAGAVGNIEIASRDLLERGHISVTERGETKNPSFTILTSSQQVAHRYLSALGLSPTAVGNLTKKKTEEKNPFDDL